MNSSPTSSKTARPKIPVGVLGATGSVGQRFVALLADHPWFELAAVTGSERSVGRPYGEAVDWLQEVPLPEVVGNLPVLETAPGLPAKLLFSALGSEIARQVERPMAKAGHVVVSNASAHRMDADVPLVVPEVNPDHVDLVRSQAFDGGALLTNPNCSTIGLVLALRPLVDAFGLREASVVTLQALSGAGLRGVPAMAITDNVVPYIGGEEDKLETEVARILGDLIESPDGGRIVPAPVTVSAQCNRVPVIDGHTECVSVRFDPELVRDRELNAEIIAKTLSDFRGEPQRLGLPSAPQRPVEVATEADRPQPRLDRGHGAGMAATVGRIRPCPIFGWKFVVLSHNTLRGAAGGSILLAELALARGVLSDLSVPAGSRAGDLP